MTVGGAGQAGGGEDNVPLVPFYKEAVTVPRVSAVLALQSFSCRRAVACVGW